MAACAKVSYEKRRYAHTAARKLKQRTGTKAIRPYRCIGCDLWHIGHLPAGVRAGVVSSQMVYGR